MVLIFEITIRHDILIIRFYRRFIFWIFENFMAINFILNDFFIIFGFI